MTMLFRLASQADVSATESPAVWRENPLLQTCPWPGFTEDRRNGFLASPSDIFRGREYDEGSRWSFFLFISLFILLFVFFLTLLSANSMHANHLKYLHFVLLFDSQQICKRVHCSSCVKDGWKFCHGQGSDPVSLWTGCMYNISYV